MALPAGFLLAPRPAAGRELEAVGRLGLFGLWCHPFAAPLGWKEIESWLLLAGLAACLRARVVVVG